MTNSRSADDKAAFNGRTDNWIETYLDPVAASLRQWVTHVQRGVVPPARAYLRDVLQHADGIAFVTLGTVIHSILQQESLTNTCANVGREIVLVTDKQATADEKIQIGYLAVSILCEVTGAARIVDSHGDRPEKTEGGVKLTPAYDLKPVSGKFLADAAEFGKIGMPSFSKRSPAPWISQKSGGVKGQGARGMVHSANGPMKTVTVETAPALFAAVNHAQAAGFRVNPVTAAIVTDYDPAKARAWFKARFMAEGMDEAAADREAKEAARL